MEDLTEENKTFLSNLMRKSMLLQVETKAAIDSEAIITMHEQIIFGQNNFFSRRRRQTLLSRAPINWHSRTPIKSLRGTPRSAWRPPQRPPHRPW